MTKSRDSCLRDLSSIDGAVPIQPKDIIKNTTKESVHQYVQQLKFMDSTNAYSIANRLTRSAFQKLCSSKHKTKKAEYDFLNDDAFHFVCGYAR